MNQQILEPDAIVTGQDPLRHALLESRQRWQDMVLLSQDLAFETDAQGRFTFIAPETAFGWPAATLLGQPAALFLVERNQVPLIDPFRPLSAVRQRRAWLRRPDGTIACFVFAAGPLLDDRNRIVGARGVAVDITEQEARDTVQTATLRRAEVLDHILWRIRQEVQAPRMMQAALDSIITAIGLEGAAVIDLMGDGVLPTILHQSGAGLAYVLHEALCLLERSTPQSGQADRPSRSGSTDGRQLLACSCATRYGSDTGLILWRSPGGRPLNEEEEMLSSSCVGLVRVILEHDSLQREMARQARTDPLTGLLNRRAFLDDMGRRLERLERDNQPGTLMFIDLDNFKALNDLLGHDSGDEALCLTAALLRGTVRAQDLVARLGGDEFALWLDQTDEFSAAERAEILRQDGPKTLAHLCQGGSLPVTMSIGIATRWPGRDEDVDALIQRADQVMYQVKRSGRGQWRVARTEEP